MKRCLWTTRHPPTQKQRERLEQHGYQVIHFSVQSRNPRKIIQVVSPYKPALLVVALPLNCEQKLVAMIKPVRVIKAEMFKNEDGWVWSGRFMLGGFDRANRRYWKVR